VQLHIWGFLIGVASGVFVYIYREILTHMMKLIWHIIPNFLRDQQILTDDFPGYNYIWIVQVPISIIIGLGLIVCTKVSWLRTPGSVGDAVFKVHSRGFIGAHHFLPMFVLSLLSLSSGASVGPEAPMVIFGAAIGGKIGRWLKQDKDHLRVLTFCGMSGVLSAFFGLPLGGALFVLEIPHRWSIQFYEALSPSIMASVIAVFINYLIAWEELGGHLVFPQFTHVYAYHMLQGAVIGVFGSLIAAVWAVGTYHLKHKVHDIIKWWRGMMVFLTLAGGIIGSVIGMMYPLTLFWGEDEMQVILDRGSTIDPFGKQIDSWYQPWMGAIIIPNDAGGPNFTWHDYLQIGIFKMIATSVQIAVGYPAGIIFPLFYMGSVWGMFAALVTGWDPTLCTLSMMAAVEVAVTRTPWGTAVVLLQLQGIFQKDTNYLAVLTIMTASILVTLVLTRYLVYYPEQKNRDDYPFAMSKRAMLDSEPSSFPGEEHSSLLHISNSLPSPEDIEAKPKKKDQNLWEREANAVHSASYLQDFGGEPNGNASSDGLNINYS